MERLRATDRWSVRVQQTDEVIDMINAGRHVRFPGALSHAESPLTSRFYFLRADISSYFSVAMFLQVVLPKLYQIPGI